MRIATPGERAKRMAPDFPRRLRGAQAILEPGHLRDAEIGLRRLIDLWVGDFGFADADRGGRAAWIFAASFEDIVGGFRHEAEIQPRQV